MKLNAVKLYDIEHISYISEKDLSSQSEYKFIIFTIDNYMNLILFGHRINTIISTIFTLTFLISSR